MSNSTGAEGHPIQNKVLYWLSGLLLAASVIYFVYRAVPALQLFIDHAFIALRFPYSMDYGEGPILDQVARLARFENIYQPRLDQYPYTVANYPPLYPLVQVPFYWLFGPSFLYGRIISLVSVILTALFIGFTLFNITRSPIAPITGGLTFLALPYILHWSPLVRVDSFALMLSWAALAVLTRWEHRRWSIPAAALLLLGAIFTRQSYGLAAPLATVVWLLRPAAPGESSRKQEGLRRIFRLILWLAGGGVLALAALLLLSRGGFYTHIVTANVNPFLWQTVEHYKHEIQSMLSTLLVIGAAYLVFGWTARSRAWFLVIPYLVVSILTALLIGKDGSNVNYLYEFCAAASLIAGVAAAWPLKRAWAAAFIIILLSFQISHLSDVSARDHYTRNVSRVVYESDLFLLQKMVSEAEGPILADEYMSLMALEGQPIVYQPFEFKMLAQAGLWNDEDFLNSIRGKKFAYILLYDPTGWDSRHARWTQETLDTITANYRLYRTRAQTSIYTPAP